MCITNFKQLKSIVLIKYSNENLNMYVLICN